MNNESRIERLMAENERLRAEKKRLRDVNELLEDENFRLRDVNHYLAASNPEHQRLAASEPTTEGTWRLTLCDATIRAYPCGYKWCRQGLDWDNEVDGDTSWFCSECKDFCDEDAARPVAAHDNVTAAAAAGAAAARAARAAHAGAAAADDEWA